MLHVHWAWKHYCFYSKMRGDRLVVSYYTFYTDGRLVANRSLSKAACKWNISFYFLKDILINEMLSGFQIHWIFPQWTRIVLQPDQKRFKVKLILHAYLVISNKGSLLTFELCKDTIEVKLRAFQHSKMPF